MLTFFPLKFLHFHTNRIVQIHAKLLPGKIVTFSCEIEPVLRHLTVQYFWKRYHFCMLDTEKERMRKKEGTNEWMIETEYQRQRMVAIAPNKATQFEALAKYWKKSIVLALFQLWQKLNCVQRLFYIAAQGLRQYCQWLRVGCLRTDLSVCKNRSHRLIPRWLQKNCTTLIYLNIKFIKFPKWLKSGNAYNLISFSSNGYDEGLYTY